MGRRSAHSHGAAFPQQKALGVSLYQEADPNISFRADLTPESPVAETICLEKALGL